MDIVVNDTNIFIDLYSIGFLDDFFRLPIMVHTVDFVLNEIRQSPQQLALRCFKADGRLTVGEFSMEELAYVMELHNTAGGNVSLTDCAVWHYAKKNNCILLTGDRQLRNKAISSNVTVKGIIYVFDQLLEHKIIDPKRAIAKLLDLQKINPRLPKAIIRERIEYWSKL